MLEGVARVGCRLAPQDQLRLRQLIHGRPQLGFGQVGDGGEQLMGELAADHGADLRHLLDRGRDGRAVP